MSAFLLQENGDDLLQEDNSFILRDQLRVVLSLSGNITASGEATTAQLTAPSGKTTSDFTAGRMQDDENPADAVDIAADFYTELEWSIVVTDAAAAADVYEFRVTAAGTDLDTYTVTPTWTVTGAAAAAPVYVRRMALMGVG